VSSRAHGSWAPEPWRIRGRNVISKGFLNFLTKSVAEHVHFFSGRWDSPGFRAGVLLALPFGLQGSCLQHPRRHGGFVEDLDDAMFSIIRFVDVAEPLVLGM